MNSASKSKRDVKTHTCNEKSSNRVKTSSRCNPVAIKATELTRKGYRYFWRQLLGCLSPVKSECIIPPHSFHFCGVYRCLCKKRLCCKRGQGDTTESLSFFRSLLLWYVYGVFLLLSFVKNEHYIASCSRYGKIKMMKRPNSAMYGI
ncbi:hypothetical protein AV530_014424 [Patagioenas fasciata monilis]|uniref:Uncharacterized protein n=1 Tax=Patagioenas fasciata monilis TaxID=372326 RepID=A0A1V4KBZ4_PATFA|nr:hypothetical protein AV530_014424 [Patagioenas fasciata monilis]